jgi:hypothetical protein
LLWNFGCGILASHIKGTAEFTTLRRDSAALTAPGRRFQREKAVADIYGKREFSLSAILTGINVAKAPSPCASGE